MAQQQHHCLLPEGCLFIFPESDSFPQLLRTCMMLPSHTPTLSGMQPKPVVSSGRIWQHVLICLCWRSFFTSSEIPVLSVGTCREDSIYFFLTGPCRSKAISYTANPFDQRRERKSQQQHILPLSILILPSLKERWQDTIAALQHEDHVSSSPYFKALEKLSFSSSILHSGQRLMKGACYPFCYTVASLWCLEENWWFYLFHWPTCHIFLTACWLSRRKKDEKTKWTVSAI